MGRAFPLRRAPFFRLSRVEGVTIEMVERGRRRTAEIDDLADAAGVNGIVRLEGEAVGRHLRRGGLPLHRNQAAIGEDRAPLQQADGFALRVFEAVDPGAQFQERLAGDGGRGFQDMLAMR